MAGALGRRSDTRLTPQGSFGQAAAIGLAGTALGLARFGYAVLLPSMRTDLRWSYTQAGGMNTANALGYLGDVRTGCLAGISHQIDERNLHGQERVGGMLHKLGAICVGDNQWYFMNWRAM